MSENTKSAAILLAGGSGNRMQGIVPDKILAPVAGKSAFRHSLEAFLATSEISVFVIVFRDGPQKAALESELPDTDVPIIWTQGGRQRQDSVWAALKAVPETSEITLIHDCARPCVTPAAIRRSIKAASQHGAACLARRVTDTIKTALSDTNVYRPSTLDRSLLWAMETPQTFQTALISKAYASAMKSGIHLTDDLSAIEAMNHSVCFIDNGQPNPKITQPQDLAYIEFLLESVQ